MIEEPKTTVVAQGTLDHLRDIQTAFRAEGIESFIERPPPAHCSS
jgi:hypothetical protein